MVRFLGIVGGISLCAGLPLSIRTVQFLAVAETANGRVSGHSTQAASGRLEPSRANLGSGRTVRSNSSCSVVAFRAQDGNDYQTCMMGRVEIGTHVRVYYDPDDPTACCAATFMDLWGTEVFLLLCGLLTLPYLLRRRAQQRRAKQSGA